ncbi:MAG: IS4 family transposase [Chitinophagales bacterium]
MNRLTQKNKKQVKVTDILELIPKSLLESAKKETKVDWNVSHFRGRVILELFLYGMSRSNRLSTHVLETLYNSPIFDYISTKNDGHQTRHSSIADRLSKINSNYFQSIFEWCYGHFSTYFSNKELINRVFRFDSTLIAISSALVSWGMRVGRPPEEGFEKVQLKFTVGMKGRLPKYVKSFFDQAHLSEETALYEGILAAQPTEHDFVVFDSGLKGREKFKSFDNQGINFVTRGADNLKYEFIRTYNDATDLETVEGNKIVQDSVVHLFKEGNQKVDYEFRLIEIEIEDTGKRLFFITNITELPAQIIAQIYKLRWEIEVFFRFIKQELSIKHLLNRTKNGVKTQIYLTLIFALLLTVFKEENKLKGYKIPRLLFEEQLLFSILNQLAEEKAKIIVKQKLKNLKFKEP